MNDNESNNYKGFPITSVNDILSSMQITGKTPSNIFNMSVTDIFNPLAYDESMKGLSSAHTIFSMASNLDKLNSSNLVYEAHPLGGNSMNLLLKSSLNMESMMVKSDVFSNFNTSLSQASSLTKNIDWYDQYVNNSGRIAKYFVENKSTSVLSFNPSTPRVFNQETDLSSLYEMISGTTFNVSYKEDLIDEEKKFLDTLESSPDLILEISNQIKGVFESTIIEEDLSEVDIENFRITFHKFTVWLSKRLGRNIQNITLIAKHIFATIFLMHMAETVLRITSEFTEKDSNDQSKADCEDE
jgi:hypothetical protein